MNRLYFGDNLDVLREYVPTASVDLIYLDPPFNSNRSYNVLFRESAGTVADSQIKAFDDTWHWVGAAPTYHDLQTSGSAPVRVVKALESLVDILGHNDVSAYLVMMTARLIELHRVLKPTGSIYLHCDPTASHYLKVVMDTVFGKEHFVNEIIWQRTNAKGLAFTRFANNHDVILRYARGDKWTWNPQYTAHDPEYVRRFYRHVEPDTGRRYQLDNLVNPNRDRPNLTYEFLGVTRVWRWTKERMAAAHEAGLIVQAKPGAVPRLKRYLDEQEGTPVGDTWTDIRHALGNEALGYPTQKPLALLERIVHASSNAGDVVLDPFCGCGTTIAAAQKHGRQWIGIDITYLAVRLIEERLKGFSPPAQYEVIGIPQDTASAGDLAQRDRYQFQLWALGLIPAQPVQEKRGADRGMDGIALFVDEAGKPSKSAVVQVKSGHVSVTQIRDLCHVVEREKAALGLMITLEKPSQPMIEEAALAGYYHSAGWNRDYPRVQIRTIAQLLDGQTFEMPPSNVSLPQGEKVRRQDQRQDGLL